MTDEQAAIQAVLAGQTERFRWLVERYERPVFCLLWNLLPDRHLCEDIAQETFLAAYKSLHRFDPARACFATWLLTIARNRALNGLKARRLDSLDSLPEPIDVAGPDERLACDELKMRLDAALNRLPLEQRTAFVLGIIMELPYDKIAQIEGVEVGTVKSRIHRARKKLAETVQEVSELLG